MWSKRDRLSSRNVTYQNSKALIDWLGLFWVNDSVTYLGQTQEFRHLILILPAWVIIAIITVVTVIVAGSLIERHRSCKLKQQFGPDYARQMLKGKEDSETDIPSETHGHK